VPCMTRRARRRTPQTTIPSPPRLIAGRAMGGARCGTDREVAQAGSPAGERRRPHLRSGVEPARGANAPRCPIPVRAPNGSGVDGHPDRPHRSRRQVSRLPVALR
jgi:hypothetical protein